MKKFAVVLVFAFVLVLVSSCNKKECPAYSRSNAEQTGQKI